MTKENLKDISKRKDFKKITKKGGMGTPETNKKKSKSAKLRWLKKRNPEIVAVMKLFKSDDPTKAFNYFISETLEQKELTEKIKDPKDKIKLREFFLNRFHNLLKLRYGEELQQKFKAKKSKSIETPVIERMKKLREDEQKEVSNKE